MKHNSIVQKVAHSVYCVAGTIYCTLFGLVCELMDKVKKPNEDTILFVAHPDDDTLFFHSFIKDKKPYVVLLFTGWSFIRFRDFRRVMKHYGVRYRAYSTVSGGASECPKRRRIVKKHIEHCLSIADFHEIATHNCSGEYGHPTHRLVHELVFQVAARCPQKYHQIWCPVDKKELTNHPIKSELLKEKEFIFENLYKSENWVMTDEAAGTPVWFYHEKIEQVIVAEEE